MLATKNTDTLTRLADWFTHQCSDQWQHYHIIHIETCDNPGWSVRIDLTDTALEHRSFSPVREGDFSRNCPSPPWIDCRVEKKVFVGAGDISRLKDVLDMFLSWATNNDTSNI